MKRLRFATIILLALLILAGCTPQAYRGPHFDLHTIAMNSLLGVGGNFWDRIITLDEDGHGRVMFAFIGDSIFGRTASILISQKISETHTYFYSGRNFIFTDFDYWEWPEKDEIFGLFSPDEIAQLKIDNDWGMEIHHDRLFRAEIERVRFIRFFTQDVNRINNIVSIGSQLRVYNAISSGPRIARRDRNFSSVLLSIDKNENTIYTMMGHFQAAQGEANSETFLVMFNRRNLIVAAEPLLNYRNYQEQLRNFKQNNGWSFYSV
jgi:hypothetical protein